MIGIDPKKFMGFVFVKNAVCMCSVIEGHRLKKKWDVVGCQMWNARLILHHLYVGSGTLLQTGYFSGHCLLSATSKNDNSPNNDQHGKPTFLCIE